MSQRVGPFPGYLHTFVCLAFSGENSISYIKSRRGRVLSECDLLAM